MLDEYCKDDLPVGVSLDVSLVGKFSLSYGSLLERILFFPRCLSEANKRSFFFDNNGSVLATTGSSCSSESLPLFAP